MKKNADFLRFFSGLTKSGEYNRFNRGKDGAAMACCGKPRHALDGASCSSSKTVAKMNKS
ncbi:hypothetical protein A7J57_23445 [Agrobacterium tumefaciens]|uniref:Uncharacterized protein n=1 Tax=Agrobacterium tumefaciens TaxID=358 RepID=A0A176WZE4_AGRTU|nr:hypothetical protein A7J57_23445 [Agrobacterium tumefaciens]